MWTIYPWKVMNLVLIQLILCCQLYLLIHSPDFEKTVLFYTSSYAPDSVTLHHLRQTWYRIFPGSIRLRYIIFQIHKYNKKKLCLKTDSINPQLFNFLEVKPRCLLRFDYRSQVLNSVLLNVCFYSVLSKHWKIRKYLSEWVV